MRWSQSISKLFVALLLLSGTAHAQVVPIFRILDNGTLKPGRYRLNLIGGTVSCVDNAGSHRTDCTFTGGGSSTLSAAYAAGASQINSTFALDPTRLGLKITDNASPIGSALFSVQNAGGPTVKFLDIGATQTQLIKSGMADGASAIGVQTDTQTTWSNATARLLTVRNANAEKLAVFASGDYNVSTDGFYYDAANQRLNIGVPTTPTGRLTIQGTNGSTSQMRIENSTGPVKTLLGAADTPAGAFIGSLSNHPLYFRQTNNNILAMSATDFSPVTTNTVDLGLTGTRWKALFLAGAANFGGGAVATGSSSFDLSGSSGTFRPPTGASIFGGSTNTFTNTVNFGDYLFPNTDLAVDIGIVSSSRFRNLYIGNIVATPAAISSGTRTILSVTGAADTNLTTTAEQIDINFNLARTVQHASGNMTMQRSVVMSAPTLSFTSAPGTVGDSALLALVGAPGAGTNATLSRTHVLWATDGNSTFQWDGAGTAVQRSVTLSNRTSAADGAQQNSTALVWRGNGWKTNATAGSQSVEVAAFILPVQGTASPSGPLVFYDRVNGADTGNAWAQTDINGYGYFGSNDAQALGTATTSSTTFVDVGNGSSTGFASWTAPMTKVTKTYTLHVSVRTYMPTLGPSVTTYFQVLQDGVAIASQPTATASQAFGSTTQYLQTTWRIAVPCTAGSTHVYKLQWKVGNASDSAGVTSTVGALQYYIEG